MNYPQIKLKLNREKSLQFRHPWVFSRAIQGNSELTQLKDGVIVDVVDNKGNFLARGYYNSRSNIAIRVLTFDQSEAIDENFFEKKIQAAFERRKSYINKKETTAYRLIFAEGDGLPGLVVDQYKDIFVLQIHTLGMESLKNFVVEALLKLFQPKAIFERSDVNVRKKDGLTTLPKGFLYGSFKKSQVEIREHGLKFLVDFQDGQKTGFFLDQRENRFALQNYVKDKTVLNLFAYSGGFSCYALNFGASNVTSVDISESALKLCAENMKLNGFLPNQHEEITAEAFNYLEQAFLKGQKFDVVIVDPPAFVKNQKKLHNAINAYIRLNEAALKVLNPGGILISSSCSSFVSQEMFKSVLFQAALRVNKEIATDLIVLEQRTQPFDHPLKINFPEGEYLKFFILQKA